LREYNLTVFDKNNLTFNIENITYGSKDRLIDIKNEILENYYKENKLFIPKSIKMNNIKGDPHEGTIKKLIVQYRLNDKLVIEKYSEYLNEDINLDLQNSSNILNWQQIDDYIVNESELFNFLLKNIKFNSRFVKYSDNAVLIYRNNNYISLPEINFVNKKINVIHLRVERDMTGHMLRHNNMTQEEYDINLQNKYIDLIQKYFSKNDVIFLLSYSIDNNVVKYLRNNNYEFYISKKNIFDGREKHAVVDLLIGEKCNNNFIGNWDFERREGSTFSYILFKRNNAVNNIFIDMYKLNRNEVILNKSDNTINEEIIINNSDWIEEIGSAWTGHKKFAEWLVKNTKPEIIVELGVDYGYSTYVFGNALKNTACKMYGIDLFTGDIHAGFRDTYNFVLDTLNKHGLNNVEIIKGDFTEVSKNWNKKINILHIDGLHTYEAVKNDYLCWSKYVTDDGIILFHDVAIPYFEVKDFFRELNHGHKLYFVHSAGLGICTKNTKLYNMILQEFDNIYDFNVNPF